MYASGNLEVLHRARVEGKLLHDVIISLHDRLSNANRKFTRSLMVPDNTHRSLKHAFKCIFRSFIEKSCEEKKNKVFLGMEEDDSNHQ